MTPPYTSSMIVKGFRVWNLGFRIEDVKPRV
jgi:hypothetical protein